MAKKTLTKKPWATSRSSLVLRLECFLVLIITIYAFYQLGGNWWLFVAVFASIDLFMIGYLLNDHIGGLFYNLGHSYIVPRILLIIGLFSGMTELTLAMLAWNAHISMDRALGYGLKHETFHLTHLGPIGPSKK